MSTVNLSPLQRGRSNRLRKGFALFFVGLIIAVGSYFCGDMASVFLIRNGLVTPAYDAMVAYRLSLHWPTTEGVITRCDTKPRGFHFPWETPEYGVIEYTYKVGKQQYNSHNIRSGSLRLGSGKYVADFGKPPAYVHQHYPVGKSVSVYYDPDNPSESYLEAAMQDSQIGTGTVLTGLGVIFLIAGIWTFFFDKDHAYIER